MKLAERVVSMLEETSKGVKRIWSNKYRKQMIEYRTHLKVFSAIKGPEVAETVVKTITKDAPILLSYYKDKVAEYKDKDTKMYKEYFYKLNHAEEIASRSAFFKTRKDIGLIEDWLNNWIDLIIN